MDEQFISACVTALGRTGAAEFQLRYSDEQQPTLWMAAARWAGTAPDGERTEHWEAAGATTPSGAAYRLLEAALDGGVCTHCGRVTGADMRWDLPTADTYITGGPAMCWYRYDPELNTFRRDCEGRD